METEESEENNETEKKFLEGPYSSKAMNNVGDTGMPGHCRSELWSCLSSVLERGIRYVKKTGDVIRYLLLHAKYILKSK